MSEDEGLQAEVVSYTVTVTNTGNVTGDVSVLGFIQSTLSSSATSSHIRSSISSFASSFSPPLAQLFDYQRVHSLAPGASASLVLVLSVNGLTQVDRDGDRWLVQATHTVWIGTADKQHAHLTHSFHTEGSSELVQSSPLDDMKLVRRELAKEPNRALYAAE